MKLMRILTLVYVGLGIVAGFISNLFENRLIAILSVLVIYMISYVILVLSARSKKRNWLLVNSLITFILVWLVVWIFLFNTK